MTRCLALLLILSSLCSCTVPLQDEGTKKIVLLAGPKSHAPGMHEYLKAVRLIKVALDNSNVAGIETEIHLDGWPDEPATLEDADLIVTISDGYDGRVGDRFKHVPWETPERMEVMQRQMDRGCGFSAIHFTTFMDDKKGVQILEWGGGYFDWQDDAGEPNWYSNIKTITTQVTGESLAKHPISNGVESFELIEEFYYNIRFRENDPRLIPILSIGDLETTQENGQVVAWAVERDNGGRGFSTTMGHYYDNWKNDNFRKLMLNGLVWAAGGVVPKGGVQSGFYEDAEVTQMLYGKTRKGLLLTGNNHPAHDWKATTPVLKQMIEQETDILIDVTTDPADLFEYDLNDYALILLNYCNWQDSVGLGEKARESFTDFLKNGGGLVVVHFANGAWHYSLPEAGSSDWPEYRSIVPRVWDHHGKSGHDKYGPFMVEPTAIDHPITAGITSFETTDELYFRQAGDIPIVPLLQATSQVTGVYEPLAWTHQYGEGKVFQILLGHSVESLSIPEVRTIIRRGAEWVTTKE